MVKGSHADKQHRMHFELLGVGFVWAWIYCAYNTQAIFPEGSGTAAYSDPSWTVSSAIAIVALVIGGFALRNKEFSRKRGLVIAAAALAMAGTLLSALNWSFGGPFLRNALIGICIGTGFALLCLLWGDALNRFPIEEVEVMLPASSVIIVICFVACTLLPKEISGFVVILMPAASALMLSGAYQHAIDVRQNVRTEEELSSLRLHVEPRSLVGLLVVLSLTYFAASFVNTVDVPLAIYETSSMPAAQLSGSCAGVLVAVAVPYLARRVTLTSMFDILTPAVVLGLALIPLLNDAANVFSLFLCAAANICAQSISYLAFIGMARRETLQITVGVGLGQSAIQLGAHIGTIAKIMSAGSMAEGSMAIVLMVLLSFASSALALSSSRETLPSPREPLAPDPSAVPSTGTAAFGTEPAISEEDPADPLAMRAAEISKAHGLTKRESEILVYLAHGRSQPYIRDALVLSKSTVASHVRHIYQKLGVHTRQELIDLFETSKERT
jgi:DNA-binding CsgD family transcriptional regulator